MTSKGNVQGESKTRVCLFCALTQRDKLEWIIQKATEAGVAEIIFFGARRALVRAGNITTAKLERWRAIAREAAEQCARGSIPQVRVLKSLQEGLHNAENCTLKLAGWEAEQEQNLSALMSEINQSYQLDKPLDLAVFIGPEGGFDADEVEKMRSAGIRLFSIGRRVLRMETAAMLIPALILYERGGFNL